MGCILARDYPNLYGLGLYGVDVDKASSLSSGLINIKNN
jgi:hypothetical protein